MDSRHKAATCQLWLSSTGDHELVLSTLMSQNSCPEQQALFAWLLLLLKPKRTLNLVLY